MRLWPRCCLSYLRLPRAANPNPSPDPDPGPSPSPSPSPNPNPNPNPNQVLSILPSTSESGVLWHWNDKAKLLAMTGRTQVLVRVGLR